MDTRSQGNPPDAPHLDLEQIHRALAGSPVGRPLIHLDRIPSTMPVARAQAEQAETPAQAAGVVVVAEEQTAGRGRLQRRWDAPPGVALLTSTVLAGDLLPPRPAQISMIGGLAALEAARRVTKPFDLRLGLKWPNDVVARLPNGLGKLAGVLVEAVHGPEGLRYAILGIGVNVNQAQDELPPASRPDVLPASLRTLTGRTFPREELLIHQCRALSRLLDPATRPTPEEIRRRWEAELVQRGGWVTVTGLEGQAGALRGRIRGVTLDGGLLVETADGVTHTVLAGEAVFGRRGHE